MRYVKEMRGSALWDAVKLIAGALSTTAINAGALHYLGSISLDVWIVLGLFALSLVIWAIAFYMGRAKLANTPALPNSEQDDQSPLQVITDRTFIRENVVLDGHDYRHCIFQHVTLTYNGGRFGLHHCTLMGFTIATVNPTVEKTFVFLKKLHFIRDEVPAIDQATKRILKDNNRWINIDTTESNPADPKQNPANKGEAAKGEPPS